MVGTRNSTLIKDELIRYITSLGLKVNTVTKARGNRGFFKEGRIDISNKLDDDAALKTLIHEFAHYINYKLDNKLKNLEVVFGTDNETVRSELLAVTKFVDDNANCRKLNAEREELKESIKILSDSIKRTYPKFSVCGELKEFNKYAKWSNLSYLEKYDRVKIHSMFSYKIYSVENVRKDFPDIPQVFVNYLDLKSKQRKRAKISRRISKLNKYYSEPCELFARFIEGLYLDAQKTKELAPVTYNQFITLFESNHYPELRELFAILRIIIF